MTLVEHNVRTTDPKTERTQFVPPSLLRVRHFLFEHGMRIIPWAPASEVLDEFRDLLQQHKSDVTFWSSVNELLTALQADLRERMVGSAQDNEVLTMADREQLLQDIRSHLENHSRSQGGFRSLAKSLPQSCQTILLLLGSAVVVSCGAMTDFAGSSDSSAGGNHG